MRSKFTIMKTILLLLLEILYSLSHLIVFLRLGFHHLDQSDLNYTGLGITYQ